jgi:hypothetical protein
MDNLSLILSTISICASLISILFSLDVIHTRKANEKPDKYEKYRNEDGLLGKKKDVVKRG